MSNSPKNILFRADSSSTIGTGHIMRDLVLAKQYPTATITFATQNLDGNINNKIIEAGYKLEILSSNELKELDNLIKKRSINMIIIDHYDIDYKFEKQLSTLNSQLLIMVLDDTYEKHYCDILLNHNISANKKKYKDLVPKDCELRCGSKYTLLRNEFIEAKKQKRKIRQKKKSKTIFIAMGGADHSNISIDILKVIKQVRKSYKQDIQANIATTNANKNLNRLKKYCKDKKWIHLHINSNEIAKLMIKSDFAIVTPSVIVNEVYYLGLPIIAIKTADNQIDMYQYLKKQKYLVLQNMNKQKLKKNLLKLLKKYNKIMKVAILTSPDQWFIPYAKKLQDIIDSSELFFNHEELNTPYDILFILSYHRLIAQNYLKKNKHNIVIHASALPKGKGWAPMFWQILEGKNEIPFTMFEASSGVDDGDIYMQKNLQLTGYELNSELRAKQANYIIDMCLEFINNYEQYKTPKKQSGDETFYKKRTAKDSKLNIDKSIKEQFNLLRIVDNKNYPAFFELDGNRYILKIELDKMGGGVSY